MAATNAPPMTTREKTADHAELARLVDDLRGVWLTRILQNRAADAIEALLSETAALKGALAAAQNADAENDAHLRARATQAERQRDELRESLVQADFTIRSPPGTDQSDVDFIRQAIANQGADQ